MNVTDTPLTGDPVTSVATAVKVSACPTLIEVAEADNSKPVTDDELLFPVLELFCVNKKYAAAPPTASTAMPAASPELLLVPEVAIKLPE